MPKSKKSESSKSEKSKPTSKQKVTKDAKPKAASVVVKAAKVELPAPPASKKKPAPKPAAPVAPVKSIAAKPAAKKPQPIVITTEEISLRAYYIAERRMAMGWPGDSSSDWVEAEAQIRREKSAS
jgi:hypothetical protein